MVCLAGARQGRPKQTMALRAGGSVCGSTVDEHQPARDLAPKHCAPGMFGRKNVSGFDDGGLVDQLQSMLELIARAQVCVIQGAG
jgi:hypothetical protein